MPGEAPQVHARLAEALAATPDAVAAEVATHWQHAGDGAQEIRWRVRAATAAAARFAREHEAAQWRRVLELWAEAGANVGDPSLSLCDVYVAAFDALADVHVEQAAMLMDEALLLVPDLAPSDQAHLLRRAGSCRAVLGEPAEAVALADRAIAAYEPGGPSRGLVEALHLRAGVAAHPRSLRRGTRRRGPGRGGRHDTR